MTKLPPLVLEKVEFYNKNSNLFVYGAHPRRIKRIFIDSHTLTKVQSVYMQLDGIPIPQNVGSDFDKHTFFQFSGTGKNV